MLGRCNDVLGMLYLGGTYDLLRCVLKNTAGWKSRVSWRLLRTQLHPLLLRVGFGIGSQSSPGEGPKETFPRSFSEKVTQVSGLGTKSSWDRCPSSAWETVCAFERSALFCEANLGQYDACFSNSFWISLIPTSQSICRCWCFPAPMATVFYPFDSFRRQPKSHWLRLWCSWLKAGASWFFFSCPLLPMAYAKLFWMIA